jgi:CBS domain-containing protein
MKASDFLRVKAPGVYTTAPNASLWSAIETMASHDIGSVVVMDGARMVGMLTFREIINAVHANGGKVGDAQVGSVMATSVPTVAPDTDINSVRRVMVEGHVRYLPILDGETLVGVISFRDVARAVLEEQGYENRMLQSYIRDWPVPENVAV